MPEKAHRSKGPPVCCHPYKPSAQLPMAGQARGSTRTVVCGTRLGGWAAPAPPGWPMGSPGGQPLGQARPLLRPIRAVVK